jgi:hypothetical protein
MQREVAKAPRATASKESRAPSIATDHRNPKTCFQVPNHLLPVLQCQGVEEVA